MAGPTYAEDVEFILSEAVRFAQLLRERRFTEAEGMDLLYSLPNPGGRGKITIGTAAKMRVRELAQRALGRSAHAGTLDVGRISAELELEISRRFIGQGAAVHQVEVRKAIRNAIARVASEKTDLVHFLPCRLHFDGPEHKSLGIGPVTFWDQKVLRPRLLDAVNRKQESERNAGDLRQSEAVASMGESVLAYFEAFGAVAEVRVDGCDEATSKAWASRVVQAAVDCLHIALGTEHSHELRMGGVGLARERAGYLAADLNGEASLSESFKWSGAYLTDEWVASACSSELFTLLGVAIKYGVGPPSPAPLAQRFLDGAAWYGEAARDTFPASRLVKYVLAMERVLATEARGREANGGNARRFSELIATRGAALAYRGEQPTLDDLQRTLFHIYSVRSKAVHGVLSPHDPELSATLIDAEAMSRGILQGLAHWLGHGFVQQELKDVDIDRALDWCVAQVSCTAAS